jgi:very-short-patch-repair endonuclease
MTSERGPNPSPLAGEGAERPRRSAGEGAGGQTQSFHNQRKHKPGVPVIATPDNAQALRCDMTDAERKLWRALRSRQLATAKFRRQVPIGPYVADFMCYAARLVIEVDGGQHADSVRDRIRDRWFRENGFRVLRFWNNEVLRNVEGVLTVIAGEVAVGAESSRSPPHPAPAAPPSPARGEGESAEPSRSPPHPAPTAPPSPARGEGKGGRS